MGKIEPAFLLTLSDLLTNLSAAWLGAALIVPLSSTKPRRTNLWVLTANLVFAMIYLFLAFKLRKLAEL